MFSRFKSQFLKKTSKIIINFNRQYCTNKGIFFKNLLNSYCLAFRDFYNLLNVQKDCEISEIKKAYYEKAKLLHPDLNPSLEAQRDFSELSKAYKILSDPKKRKIYDENGFVQLEKDNELNFSDYGVSFFFNDESISYDNHIQKEINLTFSESILGVQKTLFFNSNVPCSDCDGTGNSNKIKPNSCNKCQGNGYVTFFDKKIRCKWCNGVGFVVSENFCTTCKGLTFYINVRQITFQVPPLIENGSFLRLKGLGDYNLKSTGDLFIAINILPDPNFERKGNEIHLDVLINIYQACLGEYVTVSTFFGKKKIFKCPIGVKTGDIFELEGQGIFDGNKRGSLICHLFLDIPENFTESQKSLLKQLKLKHPENSNFVYGNKPDYKERKK